MAAMRVRAGGDCAGFGGGTRRRCDGLVAADAEGTAATL